MKRIYLVRYRTADNRVQTDFYEFSQESEMFDYLIFFDTCYTSADMFNVYVLSIQFDTV